MALKIKKSLLTLAIALSFTTSYADDIDILTPDSINEGKLLFVLDLSGSMGDLVSDLSETRIDAVRGAFQDVVNDTYFDNFSFGLSLFSGEFGEGTSRAHGITYPLSLMTGNAQTDLGNVPNSFLPDVNGESTRDYLTDFATTNIWDDGGGTPVVDAFFEAASYFRGDNVVYGSFDPSDPRSAHPSTYTGTPYSGNLTNYEDVIDETYNNPTATYNSPIDGECPANGIVILTDGSPNGITSQNYVADLIDDVTVPDPNDPQATITTDFSNDCENDNVEGDGRCGVELATFLASVDQSPSIDGDQFVNTYTVGMGLNATSDPDLIDYLDRISMAGNGSSWIDAQNRTDVANAFKIIANSVGDSAKAFSSPSISVDTSLLSNSESVYLPVFNTTTSNLWPGNLKKFEFRNGVLVDKNDVAALSVDGILLDTAVDFWTPDGGTSTNSVTSGGAAGNLDFNTRNVLTNDGNTLVEIDNVAINIDKFRDPDNTNNVDDLLQLDPNSNLDDIKDDVLIPFIKGEDVTSGNGVQRNHMGDIIHSEPVQLTYGSGEKMVFIGTNEGFLHAINDSDGTEEFAYMPDTLLPNTVEQLLIENGTPPASHIYGVDGLITLWVDDRTSVNENVNNGILEANEDAYLFFGLRRGGGTYTALDISDRDNPDLLWSKSFGAGNSWSEPELDFIRLAAGGDLTPVIIIGGGYNDDDTGAEIVGEGNDVYVINALTGDEIWKASDALGNGLPNAVPSKVRALDVDSDGSIDRLYFGDTGGNIWRADLNAANLDGVASTDAFDITEATLHQVAELGGAGPDDRKFFESPDIATFENNGSLTTAITIGSGDRPDPLSTDVEDLFFVVFDNAVTRLPDATDTLVTLASLDQLPNVDTTAADYRGYYQSLDSGSGEKVLSTPIISDGFIIFNSFGNAGLNNNDICNIVTETTSTVYVLDLLTGDEVIPPVVTMAESTDGVPPGVQLTTSVVDANGDVVDENDPCDPGDCTIQTSVVVGGTVVVESLPTSELVKKVYWINEQK